ncbi:hypothetical protein [Arthrobacter sp. MMS18-M83]|uniref:hypothetical protein n=1 Tax=Arthrobacter sp. MMS18-M83 TaxID=2996261 RepID=UPI00227A8954|nr:hypothetical protein [Arthrobacter sp. MMS18-M83]WAH97799.1 hypothetical protein OW521_02555 [Arthrobacter sp. MMS18-M83]
MAALTGQFAGIRGVWGRPSLHKVAEKASAAAWTFWGETEILDESVDSTSPA